MSKVEHYLVVVETPAGIAELEVPSTLGPEAAGRRAGGVALQQRWGDVDDIVIVSVELLTDEIARDRT